MLGSNYLTRKKFYHNVTSHRNKNCPSDSKKFMESFFLKKGSLLERFN